MTAPIDCATCGHMPHDGNPCNFGTSHSSESPPCPCGAGWSTPNQRAVAYVLLTQGLIPRGMNAGSVRVVVNLLITAAVAPVSFSHALDDLLAAYPAALSSWPET